MAFALVLGAGNAPAVNVTIQDGAKHAVCKAAAGVATKISRSEFRDAKWRTAYTTAHWKDDSYPTVTAEGREQRVSYSRVELDLDNDGQQDVVVRYTGMIRSVDFDHIYVAPFQRFAAASRTDTVGKMLQSAAQLNPGNSVHFTNGTAGVPVEIEIWTHDSTNYLVLKEHFFASGRSDLPASLFVGRLVSHAPAQSSLGGSPRLVLELMCRMSSP